ncbi:MAG: response regulator [Planctomycetales bacterium]|nr:response regulator [Planctomycetales bacterium]
MTTVLIVDDSVVCQRAAGACVQASGCEVRYAADGCAALESVYQEKPDIVLTDVQMPNMDGLELVERLREEFPQMPVILMTGFGSEEVAARALRAGASSYVPKENLSKGLNEALRAVMSAVQATRQRDKVLEFLGESQTRFVLGYEPGGLQALISYIHERLSLLNYFDESTLVQLTTALSESITNAIDHGNLELDSELREEDDSSYRQLGDQRSREKPYCDRRVEITETLTQSAATFVIRDQGPGFDPTSLPDPTDPENLLKASGRGIMLMRTFLDEVTFNETGNEVTLVKHRIQHDSPGNGF